VPKWEVVVKVVDNFNCWFVKWEVVVTVVDNFEWCCVKMGSGQNGG
jgi:hypothetical protein